MRSKDTEAVRKKVLAAARDARVVDMHTHLYSAGFGAMLLRGIDELLTYHYLVAETVRWGAVSAEGFWKRSKREQADLVWKTLFVDHSPVSEACRGVLTVSGAVRAGHRRRAISHAYREFFDGHVGRGACR